MKTIKALFLALSCTLILIACDPPAAMPNPGAMPPPGDTTAPTWTVGPAAADITPTSFTLSATLNEAGTIYWVLLADNAAVPDPATIVAGTAGTASSRGNFPAPADTAVRSDSITGVVAGTAYDVYLVAADTAGNRSPRIRIDLPADRTAPTLTAAATNPASASFTLSATLNEAGNIYYLVLPDGTDAPDSAAIVATAILGGLGTVITTIDSGIFSASADTAVTRSITGLTVNIAYDVYLVGVDTDGNQSERVMINVMTQPDTTPPTWTVGGPTATDITLTSFRLSATLNEAGRIYWVLLANNAAAPSAATIVDGTAGTASNRGNFPASADTAVTSDPITGLTADTAYDVHLVAADTAGNQSARIKIDLPADRTAPTLIASAVGLSSRGFTFSAILNEVGTIYYVVLTDDATAPDPAAIVDGTATISGNSPAIANTQVLRGITGRLTANTAYDAYFVGVDTAGNQSARIKVDVPADRTVPTLTAAATSLTPTSFRLSATLNEAGTIYYVLLADNAAAPDPVAIFAGLAGTGGELTALANTAVRSEPITVTADTAYDVYVIAEDTVTPPNQMMTPLKIDLPADRTGPAWTVDPSGSASTADGFTVTATLDEAATIYYVALSGGDAPSAAAIVDETAGTASSRGNFSATAGTRVSHVITGLAHTTDYTVYLVARDSAMNNSVLKSVTISTLDRTPPRWETDPAPGTITTMFFGIINAELNEAGRIYYVVLPESAPAPSNAAAIIGAMSGTRGHRAMQANTPIVIGSQIGITGLTAGTTYKVYFAAQDNVTPPNVSPTVEVLTVTTTGGS